MKGEEEGLGLRYEYEFLIFFKRKGMDMSFGLGFVVWL